VLFYITWPQNPSAALRNTSTRKTHWMMEQHRGSKAQLYSQPDVCGIFKMGAAWGSLALVLGVRCIRLHGKHSVKEPQVPSTSLSSRDQRPGPTGHFGVGKT